MASYWDMTQEQREALQVHRDRAGISYDLSAALEYNPGSGRNEEDIKRVLAIHEGERDEEDWVWLVEFVDGERGLYIGGCDYTGWDCRSSLTLFPFEGWEAQVRSEWPTWRSTPVDAVVATLRAGLEAPDAD